MKTCGPTTGYLWLDSWILANIVQLGTRRFCMKFLRRENDPTGRQFDQMTQAARSGVANIAEGSARHKTSRETEMKLTGVARASLAELSGDYLNCLLQRGKPMVPRKAKTGKRADSEFWGCSAYPECKGAREPGGESPKPQR